MLFIRAYNDARRAALYLCGDEADDFVPQLYTGFAGARRREEELPKAPAATSPTPPTTSTLPGVGATPAAATAPSNGRRAPGMPDSDPFGGASA